MGGPAEGTQGQAEKEVDLLSVRGLKQERMASRLEAIANDHSQENLIVVVTKFNLAVPEQC